MAILRHPEYGSEALRFCTKETDIARANITRANITPMRLLVKHMTGMYISVHIIIVFLYA